MLHHFSKHGRLAHLLGTGNQNNRIFLRHLSHYGFQTSCYIIHRRFLSAIYIYIYILADNERICKNFVCFLTFLLSPLTALFYSYWDPFAFILVPTVHIYQIPKYRQFVYMHFHLHMDYKHETFCYIPLHFLREP